MEEMQQEQKYYLDGVEFDYNKLEEAGKTCIFHIQKLDEKILNLSLDLDELKMARAGYISIFKDELKKIEDQK